MPYFHMIGLFHCLKSMALSETVVVMERFGLKKKLRAVKEYLKLSCYLPVITYAQLLSEDYGMTETAGPAFRAVTPEVCAEVQWEGYRRIV
ncbi:hypothetical protein LguiA_029473 [Lonicera macranthoides]